MLLLLLLYYFSLVISASIIHGELKRREETMVIDKSILTMLFPNNSECVARTKKTKATFLRQIQSHDTYYEANTQTIAASK